MIKMMVIRARIHNTVKPALSGHSKRRPKVGFKTDYLNAGQSILQNVPREWLLLNAGQKFCRMLQESILQYFPPSLSDNLSLRLLFCLFLSGRLRQVILYACQNSKQGIGKTLIKLLLLLPIYKLVLCDMSYFHVDWLDWCLWSLVYIFMLDLIKPSWLPIFLLYFLYNIIY